MILLACSHTCSITQGFDANIDVHGDWGGDGGFQNFVHFMLEFLSSIYMYMSHEFGIFIKRSEQKILSLQLVK